MANPNYFHPLIKVPDQPGEFLQMTPEEIDLPEQYWPEDVAENDYLDTYTVMLDDDNFIGAIGYEGKYFLTIIGKQSDPEKWSYLRH